jgi:hypothetical protein
MALIRHLGTEGRRRQGRGLSSWGKNDKAAPEKRVGSFASRVPRRQRASRNHAHALVIALPICYRLRAGASQLAISAPCGRGGIGRRASLRC